MKQIIDEGIKSPQKFLSAPVLTKEYCQNAIKLVLKKIDQNMEMFKDKYPAPASVNNIYPAIDNIDWTSSFWTGMLWLAYEVSGDEKYRKAAENQLISYQKRIDERICTDTHDLGFLYTLSCIAAFKLTDNEEAMRSALKAADLLMIRYFDKAGIIQAWGNLNDHGNRGRMIIDCCMNLPLLYWAAEMTGDRKYYDAAYNHVKQAARYIIRDDASSFHTFYMDVENGQPKYGKTAQGFSDHSCWARGQAWGIYGFTLSYIYTGDWELIELNKKVINYFINRLPEDFICYWDLSFTEGSEERDSSAAAIAACGLLEMCKNLPLSEENKRAYENASLNIINSLIEGYTSINCPESNGVLMHAVYSKPDGKGIDECNIWGDYFYFEALVRLIKNWKLYW